MRKHSHAFSLKKRYVLAVLVVILAVAVVTIAYRLIRDWEFANSQTDQPRHTHQSLAGNSDEEERPMIYYNDQWYQMRDGMETILLMGVDKYEEDLNDRAYYRNKQQTDFMLLLVLDTKEKVYHAIHLNRDTMTRIPMLGIDGRFVDYFVGQLTLAHTYGSGGADSCKNAVRAVSEFLYGTQIDHYLTMTMDAVQVLNDAVGGVTVTLQDDFTFADPRMEQGSTVTLHGSEALIYVRARGALEDSSNLSRMERQREFLNALYAEMKASSEADSGFLMKTILSVNDYMDSDCSMQELNDLSETLKEYEFLGFEETPGKAVKGETYMEFYADDTALQELLIRLFYKPTGKH